MRRLQRNKIQYLFERMEFYLAFHYHNQILYYILNSKHNRGIEQLDKLKICFRVSRLEAFNKN